MTKALYFPHTEIQSDVILKNALLLWDSVDTIVPRRDWAYGQQRRGSFAASSREAPSERLAITRRANRPNKLFREAVDLVVTRRVPDEAEARAAHKTLQELTRNGSLLTLVKQNPAGWGQYLIYPEKFLEETWRSLEGKGIASWIASEGDYSVPAVVGLFMMSLLAEACAGTQIQRITDRTEAYRWIGEHHANLLGCQYVTGLDPSQVAPDHDRLVSISIEVLDGRSVPLKKLLEMRKRELRSGGADFRSMRQRYLKALNEHLVRIGKEARSAADVKELNREFRGAMKDDLSELKSELAINSVKTLLSKEVALSALIMAGSLASPIAALPSLGSQLGGIGIIPLLKAAVDHRAARRDVLRRHVMSWLYLAKRPRLAFD